VEDELDIMEGLEFKLCKEGFEVFKAASGEKALELASGTDPSLILLDAMLPGIDGFEVCRILRKGKQLVPIIFLTERVAEVDRVSGFELGADDYIVKPFGFRELLARIQVQLRHAAAANTSSPSVGTRIQIDLHRLLATRNGVPLSLSPREFEILKFFILSEGKIVSRNRLLKEVWGYRDGITSRTVDTHILNLRRKLEDDPGNPVHLLSVYGEGYRFVD
jgi:DNA-binding response OmpR family regulator